MAGKCYILKPIRKPIRCNILTGQYSLKMKRPVWEDKGKHIALSQLISKMHHDCIMNGSCLYHVTFEAWMKTTLEDRKLLSVHIYYTWCDIVLILKLHRRTLLMTLLVLPYTVWKFEWCHTRVINTIIAWLKFLPGLLLIFMLILIVYRAHSFFSICSYKIFLVLDRNNGPE